MTIIDAKLGVTSFQDDLQSLNSHKENKKLDGDLKKAELTLKIRTKTKKTTQM